MNPVTKQYAIVNHFLSYDEDKFNEFNDSIRNPMNCITNYAIKRKNVTLAYIKSKDQIIKPFFRQSRYDTKHDDNEIDYESDEFNFDDIYYNNYEEMNVELDHYDTNYLIRIDHLNLINGFNKLKCPFCQIKLQCIPIDTNKISFICFNYPRCKYPINYTTNVYNEKFIWDNIVYIGPTQKENEQEIEIEEESKEMQLSLFDGKQTEFRKWTRYQNKKWKQLKIRMDKKWKKYKKRKLHLESWEPKLAAKFNQQQRMLLMNMMLKSPKLSKAQKMQILRQNQRNVKAKEAKVIDLT